jgi:hypothetical protein
MSPGQRHAEVPLPWTVSRPVVHRRRTEALGVRHRRGFESLRVFPPYNFVH